MIYNSAGYTPSYIAQDIDAPYDTPNAKDDEFTGTSLDAKWTRHTGGTTPTVTFNQPTSWTKFVSNSATQAWAYTQPVPAGDWTLVAKVRNSRNGTASCAGIGYCIDANKLRGICLHGNSVATNSIQHMYYTSLSTLNAGNSILTVNAGISYVGLRKVGGTMSLLWSLDGIDWIENAWDYVETPLTFAIFGLGNGNTNAFDWVRILQGSYLGG